MNCNMFYLNRYIFNRIRVLKLSFELNKFKKMKRITLLIVLANMVCFNGIGQLDRVSLNVDNANYIQDFDCAIRISDLNCLGETVDAYVTAGMNNRDNTVMTVSMSGGLWYESEISLGSLSGASGKLQITDLTEIPGTGQLIGFTGAIQDGNGIYMAMGIIKMCHTGPATPTSFGQVLYTAQSGTYGDKVMMHPHDPSKLIAFGHKKSGVDDYTLVVQEMNVSGGALVTRLFDIDFKVSDAVYDPGNPDVAVLGGVSFNGNQNASNCNNIDEYSRGLTMVKYDVIAEQIVAEKSFATRGFFDDVTQSLLYTDDHQVTIESYINNSNEINYYVTTNTYSRTGQALFNDRSGSVAVFDQNLNNINFFVVESIANPHDGLKDLNFQLHPNGKLIGTAKYKDAINLQEDVLSFVHDGIFLPKTGKLNSLTGYNHSQLSNYSSVISHGDNEVFWFSNSYVDDRYYSGLNAISGYSDCGQKVSIDFIPLCANEVEIEYLPGSTLLNFNTDFHLVINRTFPAPVDHCSELITRSSGTATNNSSNQLTVDNSALALMPNPATNSVTISLDGKYSEGNFMVYNTLGELVYASSYNRQASSQSAIDIGRFNAGVYYVLYQDVTGETISTKLIKE